MGPSQAAASLDDFIDVQASPRHARDVLIEIIVGLQWFAPEDAAEQAELWLNGFIQYLVRRQRESAKINSFLKFSFNSADEQVIQGSCYIEPRDDELTQSAKTNRAKTLIIAGTIDALTPLAFEKLCGAVLSMFGVQTPQVSRRSADQGIDFFGLAPFAKVLAPASLPAGVEKDLQVWLVGQSKHYSKTKVSTKDLRELVGSTELARSKVYAGREDPLKQLTLRICDPIFYMIMTSGVFTADSRSLIEKSGIIAMDGLQIAQFLADHGVGLGAGQFDPTVFQVWLNGQEAPSTTLQE